jgi:hypothetical protein
MAISSQRPWIWCNDHIGAEFVAVHERLRVLDRPAGLDHRDDALARIEFKIAQDWSGMVKDGADFSRHRPVGLNRGHGQPIGPRDLHIIGVGDAGGRIGCVIARSQPIVLGLVDDAIAVIVEQEYFDWQAMMRHRRQFLSYGRKLVTALSGGVFDLLDPVLERYSFDEFGELA